ncbi:hypothetical protein FOE78_18970 [Microlunatus elymi]|uniref:Uncharacterized protein n=1 Tax=Microlunatus elymi TaxID=2596828 RepID=A0A516Q2Q4_9ACTN|nr:hypothetical protein [Microlunatus elymi]QDP97713.1 hypothetical protein FOE78_18970 [Microlunatus elymi]
MLQRTLRKIAIALGATTAGISLIAVNVPSSSAATTCTLQGSLPSKIVINKRDVIVHSKLSGSGDCKPKGGGFSYAAANLDGPQGAEDFAYWDRIGDSERFDFWAYDITPGSYTLRDGDAWVYDADYNDVPVKWKATSTKIKFGSRVISTKSSRKQAKVTVSATAQRYTADEKYKSYKTKVYLQRKTKNAKSYSAYKTLTSSATGKISYSYSTKKQYRYRFVIKDAASVCGSTSASTYR